MVEAGQSAPCSCNQSSAIAMKCISASPGYFFTDAGTDLFIFV